MNEKILKNKKAVIYCRVSSREQEETGYSLDSQEKLLKEYTEKKDLLSVKIFKISESASGKIQREKFKEMIDYASKNKIESIVCEKVDRLTRSFKDAVAVDDWLEADDQRKVHLVKNSLVLHKNSKSQEKLNWGIQILFAKNYTDNLSEEVKKGQKEKIAQGWLPTKPPLGYTTIGEKGHKTHIVDADTAPYIKNMFEMYATGEQSISAITTMISDKGFRTRMGNKISRSRVHNLLTDPFYYGDLRWDGEIYKGKQEPIISVDLWEKVQKLLTDNNTGPKTPQGHTFRGKVLCEHCGGLMTWYKQKKHIYGHCSYHGKSKDCKGKTCLREEIVTDQVISMIEGISPANKEILSWIEDVIRSEYKDKADIREDQMEAITDQLKKVRQKKDKIMEARILQEAPEDFCKRKLAEYYTVEKELERNLSGVTDSNNEYQNLTIMIHELAYRGSVLYQASSPEQKRLLMRELFTSLIQDGETITPRFTKSADYLHKWMPIINNYYELNKKMPEVKEFIALSGFSDDKITKTTKSTVKGLRTVKYGSNKSKSAQSGTSAEPLLPGQDSNLRPIA